MSSLETKRNDPETDKPGLTVSCEPIIGAKLESFTNDFTIWAAQYIPGKQALEIWFDEEAPSERQFADICDAIEEYLIRLINFTIL